MDRALLLVAHPDDEVIFAGGLLLSYPNLHWTMSCLTLNGRSSLFPRSAEEFAHRGVNVRHVQRLHLSDEHCVPPLSWYQAAESMVAQLAKRIGPQDFVFTHNRRGDYGHPHHVALNRICHDTFQANLWEFYSPVYSGVGPMDHQEIGVFVENHSREKIAIFRTVYGEGTETALRQNQPDLMRWYLDGDREHYTSANGDWPVR